MELKKLSEFEWELPKTTGMNVPGRVFASQSLLEVIKGDRTLEQLKNMTSLPGIQKYALALPDSHQGYGFCIGGVAALSTKDGGISPGGIGFDINCGVRLMRTSLKKSDVLPKLKVLVDSLFRSVPMGVGKGSVVNVSRAELDEVLSKGCKWLEEKGFATSDDLLHTEEGGWLKDNDPKFVSERAKSRGLPELGSLGSGNHFLEVQYVEEVYDEKLAKKFGVSKDDVVVMIHCGSRGLGHQVASDYLRKIENEYPKLVNALPDRELAYAPSGSRLADEYFKAMNCAANFAWANRQLLMHVVREQFKGFFGDVDMKLVYDVCHNIAKVETYGGVECFVHRKGATRSFPGYPVILPGSMGTGCYLMVGSDGAMKKSFGSTAHGSGRLMSRNKAKLEFPYESVVKQLESQGILLRSASKGGVSEEAPGVYKSVDEVARVSEALDLARKVARIKPLGVIIG